MSNNMESKICSIDKHVTIMNREMGELRDEQKLMNKALISMSTDIEWIKRLSIPIYLGIIASVVSIGVQILR
jgi:hypothetical protein